MAVLGEVEDLSPRRASPEGRRQIQEVRLGVHPADEALQPQREIVPSPVQGFGVGREAGTVQVDAVLAGHEDDEEPGPLPLAQLSGLSQDAAERPQRDGFLFRKAMGFVLEVYPHIPSISFMKKAGGIGQGARRVLPQLRPDEPSQGVQRVAGEGAEEEGVVPPRQLGPDGQGLLVPLHVLEVVALEEGPDAGPWMERQAVAPQHLQLLLRAVPGLPQVDDPGMEIARQA